MNTCNPVTERAKVPKDGVGPRGVPDCYYTSRVLNSTARYVRFVNKLRAQEKEDRRGVETKIKERKDNQYLDFFLRCDRRNIINKVQNRVDICLESYEQDVEVKRMRLRALLNAEEKYLIRRFTEMAQEGAERAWQDKKDRLAYLLDKRQKEHDARFKDVPLEKCSHVYPCLVKIRAKEAQEAQLYQMREKQMRKMAEAELDNMWHMLAMKESEALAARMEYETMEVLRRQKECDEWTEEQLEQKRRERAKEREVLMHEALMMKNQREEDKRQALEDAIKNKERSDHLDQQKLLAIKERRDALAKQQAEDKLIEYTWESIAGQSLTGDRAEAERRTQKLKDLNVCNARMVAMKHRIAEIKNNNEDMILHEGQKIRDQADLKRCQIRKQLHKNAVETARVNYQTGIEKKERNIAEQNDQETQEYNKQLKKQIDELVKHKQMTDAQAQKLYQEDLLDQINYSNLLKKRAMQEELEQRKKGKLARQEYQDSIKQMLQRHKYH